MDRDRPKFIGPFREAEFKIWTFAKQQNILRGCPRLCAKNLKSIENLF